MAPNEALETVKYLVEQCGASVWCWGPHRGGSSQAVKGYLLPRQLQQETAEEQANNPQVVAPPPPMGGTPVQAQPQPSSNYADPLEMLMRPPNAAPPGGFGSPMPMGSPPPPVAMPVGSPMMGHPGGAQQQMPPPGPVQQIPPPVQQMPSSPAQQSTPANTPAKPVETAFAGLAIGPPSGGVPAPAPAAGRPLDHPRRPPDRARRPFSPRTALGVLGIRPLWWPEQLRCRPAWVAV